MSADNIVRRLRGAFGNALVWGAGWFAFALAVSTILRLVGVLPKSGSWLQALGLAARFGIVGFVAGGAFSAIMRFVYHGRRLREINWVRFGIAGGSLKLAQRADAVAPAPKQGRLDGVKTADRDHNR